MKFPLIVISVLILIISSVSWATNPAASSTSWTADPECDGDPCKASYTMISSCGYTVSAPNMAPGQGADPVDPCEVCKPCSIPVVWAYNGGDGYQVMWNYTNGLPAQKVSGRGTANGTFNHDSHCNEQSEPDQFEEWHLINDNWVVTCTKFGNASCDC